MGEAEQIFESSPMNITADGKRHLGAAIGSNAFKDVYISEMVSVGVKKSSKNS